MSAVIREFLASDYSAAHALWEVTPGVGLSETDQREPVLRFLLRNPGLSFVALQGSALVGTILCGHDGRRGLIHHLVVAEAARRQGIGLALLRSGLSALHREGISKCHLLVFRNNTSGLDFWRAVKAIERTELTLFSLSTQSAA